MARKWTDGEKQRLIRGWSAEVCLYNTTNKATCSKGRVCATASKEIYDLTLPVSKYTILELIYSGINTLRT